MDLVDEPYKQYEIKEGIVFLIELSDPIYSPILQLDGQSQIAEILNCINDLLSEMIMTFPNNGVGIYLYNCKHTGSKYPKNSGLTKIFSLNDLNSSNMKSLINTLQDDLDESKTLVSRFPPAYEPSDSLHTVLKSVLREFQRKPQYNHKKLFWFTNNDKPYVNEKLKDSLRTMISDFEDNHVHVTPLFLDTFVDEGQKQTKHFDASLYKHIFLNTNYLKNVESDYHQSNQDARSWSNTTVSSRIRDAIFRLKEVKRVQFSCDLVLSDGPGIGGQLGCSIKGYTLYNHEHVRQFKKVSTESGEIKIAHNDSKTVRRGTDQVVNFSDNENKDIVFKGVPVKFSNDTGAVGAGPNEKVLLLKPEVSDFMKSYAFDHIPKIYADESVEDDDDEDDNFDQIEFSSAPYLKLLCFKSLHKFQPYFNMKPPLFVAADLADGLAGSSIEGGYVNSFDTFKNLYQSCARLKKYAIVFGCTKKNSNPDLYALYPTNTKESEDKKTSDGFLLINLPWLSEIRSLPDHMLTGAQNKLIPHGEAVKPRELTALYENLIDRIGQWADYEPKLHNNPTLQYFYNTIKHEALQLDIENEDRSLKANDWSVRELIKLRNSIGNDGDIQDILKILSELLDHVDTQDTTKRGAVDVSESESKRAKPEVLSEAAIITLWKSDTWSNVTVAQLREFMGRYNRIKKATRKAEMVANIVEYLESRRR